MKSSRLGILTSAASRVWPTLIVLVLASACNSTPTRHEPSAAKTRAAIAEHPGPQDDSIATLKEQAFFNLAPLSLRFESENSKAPPTVLTQELRPGAVVINRQGTTALHPETLTTRELSTLSEEALIEELSSRWGKKWSQAGAIGSETDWSTLRDGLALGLLRPDHGSDEVLKTVAALAASKKAPDDVRLLAAAYHAHHGAPEAAELALAGLFEAGAAEQAQGNEEAVANSPFQITALSFARNIEGPSKFTPATQEEILPGRKVLIYGEFRHFRNEPEGMKGVGSTYRRSFSATLRIVSSSGKELDRLEFLPRERGLQRSQTESEVTNFWAKYQLPADLPPGAYKIIVEANDVLGNAAATAELAVDIKTPAKSADSVR